MNTRKIKTVFVAAFMLPFFFTSFVSAQTTNKCLTGIIFDQWMKKNPELFKFRVLEEKQETGFIKDHDENKISGVVRIIPVVFHIIHEGGSENISKAQVLDQMRILNEDIRRLNPDTVNTPVPFKPFGADCEIEFRLAQIDPSGNCTDGIVRVFSHLTNSAGDNVKALSSWDNSSYLNIWIVRSIYNFTGSGGTILGYAYYPGTAPPGADGVIMRSDYTGSIGAIGFGNVGRTLTHEVGHYLNLIHIWGDNYCGNDQVFDTPTAQGNNFGCVGFPHVTCNNAPNGDMFSNYMDYSDDGCMNIFTWGQKARMDNTLAGFRANLVSSSNLIATGTNGVPPVACTLIPDFYSDIMYVCSGDSVKFKDASWNGDPVSWSWSFPGGNPSSSIQQNPVVQYSTTGVYDVMLSVTNAAGTVNLTKQTFIHVNPGVANFIVPYTEDFEAINFPSADWEVINDGGAGWQLTTDASVSGISSVKLDNFSGNIPGSQDIFISPAYDFSNISYATATFRLASAGTVPGGSDNLKVYVSNDCGQIWSLRYIKTGNAFYTAGVVTGNFIPNSSQWRIESMNLSLTSFSGQPNIKFKFVYTHDSANNIFIDDLNITGTPLGIEQANENNFDVIIYPNPAIGDVICSLQSTMNEEIEWALTDLAGREIYRHQPETVNRKPQTKIIINAPKSPGVYLLKLKTGEREIRRKIIFL